MVEELVANGGSGFTQCAVSLLSAMFNLVPKWLQLGVFLLDEAEERTTVPLR